MSKKMVLMLSVMESNKFRASLYVLPDMKAVEEVLLKVSLLVGKPTIKTLRNGNAGLIGNVHWNTEEIIIWDSVSNDVIEDATETVKGMLT
jgi:hypothetical protein